MDDNLAETIGQKAERAAEELRAPDDPSQCIVRLLRCTAVQIECDVISCPSLYSSETKATAGSLF